MTWNHTSQVNDKLCERIKNLEKRVTALESGERTIPQHTQASMLPVACSCGCNEIVCRLDSSGKLFYKCKECGNTAAVR